MYVKAKDIISTLLSMGDELQRENLMRFFKTGKGEYGEGDNFIGIKVPDTRIVVKEARLRVPLEEIEILLNSEWHEARLCGFAERANTLTGTERTILQYYMDGYTVKDIPELARISASTVKTHNRNLYRKLGVDSFDELKVYIELFASCGRSGELLNRS